MALKAEYDKTDEIPEAHRELYQEQNGKHVFVGVEGWFGPAERTRLGNEAGSHRIKAKEATERLAAWQRVAQLDGKAFEKPEELQAILDEYPTLKAAAEAGGGKSKEAVAAQVEIEKKRLETGFTRQLNDANTKLQTSEKRISQYENRERVTAIREHVVKAIGDSKIGKINPDALEDVLLWAERHLETDEERDEAGVLVIKAVRTKDGVGITPGLEAAAWLAELQPKKGHWYMPSEGGGSIGTGRGGSGGGGANPWSAAGWNLTEQGQYFSKHGAAKAEQMARAAGTVLGGPPPAPPPGQQRHASQQRR